MPAAIHELLARHRVAFETVRGHTVYVRRWPKHPCRSAFRDSLLTAGRGFASLVLCTSPFVVDVHPVSCGSVARFARYARNSFPLGPNCVMTAHAQSLRALRRTKVHRLHGVLCILVAMKLIERLGVLRVLPNAPFARMAFTTRPIALRIRDHDLVRIDAQERG